MKRTSHGTFTLERPVWDRLVDGLRTLVAARDAWSEHVGRTGCCYCGSPIGVETEAWLSEHVDHPPQGTTSPKEKP